MGTIDYNPGYSAQLRGLISEPFAIAREQRDKKRREEEYKRQNDLSERRLNEQDIREKQRQGVQNADRNSQLFQKISSLAATSPSEAEALAKSSQYTDPQTGELKTIQFDRGQAADPLPPAPQLQEPTMQLPQKPNFDGFFSQAPGVRLPQMDKLQIDPSMLPENQAPNYSAMQHGRNPAITTPDGQRVEFDPAEAQQKKINDAKERASRMREMATREVDPALRQSWLRQADIEEAAIPGAAASQLRNRESQEDSQAFQQGQQGRALANAKDIAAMRKRNASGLGAGHNLKTQKAEADITNKQLQAEGHYTSEVQKVLQNLGYKDMNTKAVKINDLAATIAMSDTNPAAAAAGKGTFVKFAQGGSGVVSDSDMEQFWNRMGGLGMRASEAWKGYTDGTLPPEKKKYVADLLKNLEANAHKNMDGIGRAIETTLNALPGGKERVPRYLGTYAPDYLKTRTAEKAAHGDQGSLDSLEADIDARMQRGRK